MTKEEFEKDVITIFYNEIVPECANKELSLGDFKPTLFFKTQINDNYKINNRDINPDPILIINNKEKFNKLLCYYVKVSIDYYFSGEINPYNIKCVSSLIFANATSYDLSNPIFYLNKRIKMLEKNLLMEKQTTFNGYEAVVSITKADVILEAPYTFKITIFDDNFSYELPRIMFGIYDNAAYIYAIQNKFKGKNKLQKKINRLLFKFNDGFKEEKKDDLLNGTDVTMSFIASILIFIKYLNSINISKIKIVPNMPIRYNSHYESYQRRLDFFKEIYSDNEFEDFKKMYDNTNKSYDDNVYMKIIRTFYRISMQTDVICIKYSPLSLIDGLEININENGTFDNELYNNIYNNDNYIK